MILSKLLGKHSELIHGFSSAGAGNMSMAKGPAGEVLGRRRAFCEAVGVQAGSLVMVDQVHGGEIVSVTEADRGKGAATLKSPLGEADGLCTDEPGVTLAVLVADCAAVYCYDPECGAIGLAHSGWRGTAHGIAGNLVNVLCEGYGCGAHRLLSWVSPCIGGDSFEVGTEVLEQFRQGQPDVTRDEEWFHPWPKKGKWYIDLKMLIERQLLQAGLKRSRLEVSPECTYSNVDYFSYRRTGTGCGHMMALMALRES
jgi:YfiH family protein